MSVLKQGDIKTEGSLDLEIKSGIKDLISQSKSTEEECKECGAKLKNKTILQNHIRKVHVTSPPVECKECGITLKHKTVFRII